MCVTQSMSTSHTNTSGCGQESVSDVRACLSVCVSEKTQGVCFCKLSHGRGPLGLIFGVLWGNFFEWAVLSSLGSLLWASVA